MKGEECLRLVPLHAHPQYKEDCLTILNSQWPRSRTMRMRSLSSSCDQFPTSLVLLHTSPKEATEVIGHSRLSILPREPSSAWVESVIIRHDLRGAGCGRHLMIKTEEYARLCGFSTIYLSTHDQQVFYGKLGYEFCAPVCIYGGSINKHLLPKHFITPQITKGVQALTLNSSEVEKEQKLIFAESLEVLVMALEALHEEAKPLGLEVSWLKTKVQLMKVYLNDIRPVLDHCCHCFMLHKSAPSGVGLECPQFHETHIIGSASKLT
ncbi:N-acetyltransferase 6 [Chionoecetes opilio]|uniref:N-acetyltransferase 6 n=1 Tax=Chionoecetes opilio TaxID=41210 RepID=A0A8J4YQS3_CHIOP|nr:N-acetyltransferase 6 [Chionoecetes opilio]